MGVFIGPAVTTHPALGATPALDDQVIIQDSSAGAVVTATVKEVNANQVVDATVSVAIDEGVNSVELNHATVVVAATIADAANHAGLFVVKDTSASGTAAHTLTLTAGTFDGTNNVATLNAPDEQLAVYFDSNGKGIVILNTGTVALS